MIVTGQTIVGVGTFFVISNIEVSMVLNVLRFLLLDFCLNFQTFNFSDVIFECRSFQKKEKFVIAFW